MKLFIAAQQLVQPTGLPKAEANQDTITTLLNIAFVIIGALAFLMILIAGLRYVMAQGDPGKVAEAKNMVLYSLIGLIIAALAATIVNFVLGRA